MHSKFAWFLTLAVFSGMSMNLILRFGIGLQRVAMDDGTSLRASGKNAKWMFLVWPGIYFISIILLWLFFSILQSVVFIGYLEYILIFPVSFLFFIVIEYLVRRMFLRTGWRGGAVSLDFFDLINGVAPVQGGGGALNNAPMNGGAPMNGAVLNGVMVGAALFIILGLAGSFTEAVMFSFGFSCGAVLAVLIVGEIWRRSATEAVPRSLRGGPLVFISMGLLSLVCISAAMVFYAVLGAN